MKPFRFGVNVGHAYSRSEWTEKAGRIEALGYDILTVPDHPTDLIAPLPALITAAEPTKRLRVGTNVLNNDLRHPVLLAHFRRDRLTTLVQSPAQRCDIRPKFSK